jgi:hypothetical protein
VAACGATLRTRAIFFGWQMLPPGSHFVES